MFRLLIALAASVIGVAAHAHAFLIQAVPPVGGVISAPPGEIRITFTEGIEQVFSHIELMTTDGQPINTAQAAVDPRDNAQLVLPLPHLAPGRYRVRWHVVSVDTHPTEGDYVFEVRP
jgi:copper resistance protein C